jgi:hypothetical protein
MKEEKGNKWTRILKRRINNKLDADKLRFIDVFSSTCFGHHQLICI